MSTRFSLMVCIIFIMAASCGGSRNTSDYSASPEIYSPKMAMEEPGEPGNAPVETMDMERKIIKTGDIRFETKSIEDTRRQIMLALEKYKGYVSNEGENSYGDRLEQNLQVRVPSGSFDKFLEEITAGITRFEYKNINSSDVTQEYIDVESRLNTKKELEKRYLEILSKARTVTEMLEIERELNNVRADIESMTGRLKYLQSQVSYSTLNITYYVKNIQPLGFWTKVVQGLGNGWQYLLLFLVGLVNIWPFILLILGLLFLAFRISRRKKVK